MQLNKLVLPSLVLGGAAIVLGPAPSSEGFSLIGDSLGLNQRDFRVFNNFSKPGANNNNDPDDNFPGHQGAVMAIWKACVEWGSELHGSGNGDPTQPGDLGSGGANFDAAFMGEASSVGSSSQNIHSQISGGSGGVLAFAEGGFSGAWRIRYYETWDWDDGPGSPAFADQDLQGIACHEYGHALGLGHSSVGGTTMFATASGTGVSERSIEPDDIAGVQAIYGSAAGNKPSINSINISGNQVTISGTGFSNNGNQVWFTNANTTSSGSNPFVKLTNVSSTGGGTQITVNIPGNGGPGDIFVQRNSSANSALSNAWPFDPDGNPPPPTVTGITPSSVTVVNDGIVPITLTGNGFETVVDVRFDGASVDWTLTAAHDLTFNLPEPAGIGTATVEVDTLFGSGSVPIDVVANDPPLLVNQTPILFVGQLAQFTIGAEPGSIALLAASTSPAPSVLDGVIAADLGNNFLDINLVAAPVIDSTGSVDVSVLTGGLPNFITVYFQGAILDTSGTLPLPTTERAEVILL